MFSDWRRFSHWSTAALFSFSCWFLPLKKWFQCLKLIVFISHLCVNLQCVFLPCRLDRADEELGPVSVGPGVGHGQDAFAGVLQCEVLISKLVAVDGLSTSSIVVGEVASLQVKQRQTLILELHKLTGTRPTRTADGVCRERTFNCEKSKLIYRLQVCELWLSL